MVTAITLTVAEMRTRLGLTRSELARLLKVTTRTVHRWEAEQTSPHPIYLETLARLVQHKEQEVASGQSVEQA